MELFHFVGSSILIIISIFLSYYVLSSIFYNSKVRRKTSPPVAGGAWPFVGHIPVMANGSPDKLPHIVLSAMADKNGPIFSIQLGTKRAVVVSNWKLAKELFTKYDVAVSSRPRFMASELLGYDMAMFGFSPFNRYWREVRKLISMELLSSRRIDIQKHILVSETLQSIKELYNLWNDKNQSGSALINMKEWLGDLNLNVVLRMVVGKRYFGSSGDTNEARHCRKVMRSFFHLAGVFTLGDTLPYLKWLDIGGYEKKMKQTSKALDSLVGTWLVEHRDRGYYKLTESKQQDFMDVMLALMQTAKLQSDYDDDTIIKSTCSNLISGASDTITVMLVWSLSLLSNNPNVLKKVQQELDRHIGKERVVNESDIRNLVYLQAMVKEILRLYPAAPLLGREFTQDCNVGGYDVPKGTWLFVNVWKLQRDPHNWAEPTEFRPERFLETTKDISVKSMDFELIPFGAGRRICPGLNFGLEMMHLVLAKLLQAFDFSTPYGESVDMAGSPGVTNSKATPLEVLVAPRLSHSLY